MTTWFYVCNKNLALENLFQDEFHAFRKSCFKNFVSEILNQKLCARNFGKPVPKDS